MVYDRVPTDPPFVGIPTFLRLPFISTLEELRAEQPDVVILGAPFDMGTTNRPGARFGPRAIRAASNLGRTIHHIEMGVQPLRLLKVSITATLPSCPTTSNAVTKRSAKRCRR